MLTFTQQENTLSVMFTDPLNSESCKSVEPELNAKLEAIKPKNVVFDLSDISYIASAFLRICLVTYKNFGSENFEIVNTQPAVMKVFKMAGVDQKLNIS